MADTFSSSISYCIYILYHHTTYSAIRWPFFSLFSTFFLSSILCIWRLFHLALGVIRPHPCLTNDLSHTFITSLGFFIPWTSLYICPTLGGSAQNICLILDPYTFSTF